MNVWGDECRGDECRTLTKTDITQIQSKCKTNTKHKQRRWWVNPRYLANLELSFNQMWQKLKRHMYNAASSVDRKSTEIIRAGKRHHLSDQKWWGVGLSGQQQKNVKVTEIENTQRWDLSTGKPLRLPAASSLLRRGMIWNNNAMFVWSREGESERNLKYRSVESVKTKTTEIVLLEHPKSTAP